jgi:adenine C2-methylase RlmN of 23S rRNA A2503 and tRNA A37
MDWDVLESQEDSSVNFVADKEDGGKIETRFVQRDPDYFIVYLSSHTGCNKSCRMCHLTATGQTYFTPTTPNEYLQQAERVFRHWYTVQQKETKTVHFNFMARGEPLANPHMLRSTPWRWTQMFNGDRDPAAAKILLPLFKLADLHGLQGRIKISTIMPLEMENVELYDLFIGASQIYYSLYSVNEQFRKRWIPKALPTDVALEKLKTYQSYHVDYEHTWSIFDGKWLAHGAVDNPIAFHWAFIEGENDSVEDVEATCQAILDSGVTGQFNLVRYNPPNNKSRESSQEVLERNFKIISEALGHPGSQIIPRVGFDVKASCGMFV